MIKGDEAVEKSEKTSAILSYQEVVKADNSNFTAYVKLGQVYDDLDEKEKAASTMRKLCRLTRIYRSCSRRSDCFI